MDKSDEKHCIWRTGSCNGRAGRYHDTDVGMPRRLPDKGTILMKQRLADMAGKEVTALTVAMSRVLSV
jgi:hypothetical protein